MSNNGKVFASIAAQSPQSAPAWESQIDLVKRTVAAGATDDEFAMFLHQARRTGLDPLARQIYCVVRGKGERAKAVIQTGIDGFRLVADRTGNYAGSDDPVFGPEVESEWKDYNNKASSFTHPTIATVTVRKMVHGMPCAFTASARWSEYYPGDIQGAMWRKMPHTMLSKCAEALALRKAFPADLSGLYTADEMAQAGDVPQAVPATASATERERNAGLFIRRTLKMDKPQFDEFKEKTGAEWPMVALDAEQDGVKTFADLMRYAIEGIKPGDTQDAEFTEVGEIAEGNYSTLTNEMEAA